MMVVFRVYGEFQAQFGAVFGGGWASHARERHRLAPKVAAAGRRLAGRADSGGAAHTNFLKPI